MEEFNRYETELDSLAFAFGEGKADYCKLKDYSVTKEECLNYLNALKEGRELNKKWRDSRAKKIRVLVKSICILLCISLPFLLVWGLDEIGLGGWSILAYYVSLCIMIGISGRLYKWVIDNQWNSNTINKSLFPAINMDIEQLFDDYLKRRNAVGVKERNGSPKREMESGL